jgi:hypothetical protein
MNDESMRPGAGHTEPLDSDRVDDRSRPQNTPDQPETLGPYIHTALASPARIEAAIAATLGYLDRGWQVFPAIWTGQKPTRELPDFDNDYPLWNQDTDPADVRQAFEVLEDDALIALATGPKSGVLVIRLRATMSVGCVREICTRARRRSAGSG